MQCDFREHRRGRKHGFKLVRYNTARTPTTDASQDFTEWLREIKDMLRSQSATTKMLVDTQQVQIRRLDELTADLQLDQTQVT